MRAESFAFETAERIQPYPGAQKGAPVSKTGHFCRNERVTSGFKNWGFVCFGVLLLNEWFYGWGSTGHNSTQKGVFRLGSTGYVPK